MSDVTLAEAVLAEAARRYEDGGWDVLVECWTTADFTEHWDSMVQYGETRPATVLQALASVSSLVDIWADRQADARNSAF